MVAAKKAGKHASKRASNRLSAARYRVKQKERLRETERQMRQLTEQLVIEQHKNRQLRNEITYLRNQLNKEPRDELFVVEPPASCLWTA